VIYYFRNKCDISKKVSREEAISFAKAHEMIYLESSAKDRIMIDEIFEILAKRILVIPEIENPKKKNKKNNHNCNIQ
jgi:hypothetical protein